MKKAAMVVLMAALAASALFAHGHGWRGGCNGGWRGGGHGGWRGRHGVILPAEEIPQAAQDFISAHFPGRTVQFAGGDFGMYTVALSDGTEIGFAPDGDWRGIRSYAGVPLSVLPQEAADSAQELYPDVAIMIAEKDLMRGLGIRLMLANSMEMYFDNSGKMLGQRFYN